MFFCRKQSKSGWVLQLLESYRNQQGKPTHRVVVSLGDASLSESSWKSVAKYIESRLYGYRELLEPPACEKYWIDSIVKRIEREGKWQGVSKNKPLLGSRDSNEARPHEKEVVDGVLIDDVNHTHETTLGPELVGLKAWDELGLDDLFKEFGFSGAQRRGAACSVINRLVDPVSENKLPLWLETSSLPDLLGEDCLYSKGDKYYKISDLLYKRREEIEEHLSEKIAQYFGFQRTYILYDLTNTHFEGECRGNKKAKRGNNKQKRNDCVQVVVGICFDEHGFVLFHKTFSGNMSDSTSLLEMVSSMQACSSESNLFTCQRKSVVIVDAGIATKDNVKLLRDKGFSYLVNETRKSRKKYEKYFDEEDKFIRLEVESHKDVSVRVRSLDLCNGEVESEATQSVVGEASGHGKEENSTLLEADPENSMNTPSPCQAEEPEGVDAPLKERLVLCRSQPRKAKEQAIYSGAEEKFIKAMEKLCVRIEKGQLKDISKIERAIGKIESRHTRASTHYTVTYTPPEKASNPTWKKQTKDQKTPETLQVGQLSFQRKDKKKQVDPPPDSLLGCYVLRTDQCDISAEQLWHLYMTLTKAENGFRALKSDCGLRPNFHQLEHRVDAHIFISILAYQLQRFILYALELQGDYRSWDTIRRVLQTHPYCTIIVPTNKGMTYRIRKPGIPGECQRHIYKQLGVDLNRLPKSKIVTRKKSTTL